MRTGVAARNLSPLVRAQMALMRQFCRAPDAPRPINNHARRTGQPLAGLRREYPDLHELVSNRRVLDFGCGTGDQAIALAETFNCRVVGLDINENTLSVARRKSTSADVSFVTSAPVGSFDVVISYNSFEHFSDPAAVLEQMRRYLTNDGVILLSFGCPWYSPYGAHMHHFCSLPWVNLLFSEQAVLAVRADYNGDGATCYEEVESGLNRMTIRKFEHLIAASGLEGKTSYRAVRGLQLLSRLPVLRELFINHVSAVLRVRK